ncbi:complex I intermediate-associated protein 30 (CIA30) [mine drainage metagenome]|uniref:Complex I intermediate-associated protein 30 (CIA30) n=1 Tax=mine drainage metagenome TaxID=410659 RepID=A0A1J5SQS0_9ZZZZ
MQVTLILDDRSSKTLLANNGCPWRAISDTVMGGTSSAQLVPAEVDGRTCLRLTGEVSLENNGGFVQASLDLSDKGLLDASKFSGIELDVLGNNEIYNLHLRTDDTKIVWQSYRASFNTTRNWQTIRIPFDGFIPHRIDVPLDTSRLRRLGVVAIGRTMQADICISRLALYLRA